MEVTLNELFLYASSDRKKEELSGEYTKEALIERMIHNWIPWMECHKCGKWDYCKYVEKHQTNPEKAAEIQCGVGVDFIKNFINTTFELIIELSNEEKQAYLNSAFYLSQYVQNTEIMNGTFINDDYLSYWGSYTPSLYGFTKKSLGYLNQAHKEMKHLTFMNSKSNVILVEGFSEAIFVENFSDIEIVNYEGKGRLASSKIEFLVKQYKEKGYEVYLQTDKDGKAENENLNRIIREGLIKKENIFQFNHDFETAIPVEVLYKILMDNNIIDDTLHSFKTSIDLKNGIVKHIEKKYDVSIRKRMIATEISLLITQLSRKRNLYSDKTFLNSEIGRFWEFIKKII